MIYKSRIWMAVCLVAALGVAGCAQTSETAYKDEGKKGKGEFVAPQQLCQIALVPGGGPVTVGTAPPLRVAANTNQGCTVQFNPPETVVPVGAYNPRCVQVNPGPANNILVTCPGVPVPANPPTSAVVLTFSCTCPAGGLARNARADAYNF